MYYSKLAAPILLVADCTQAPPLDLAEEVLGSEILAYARQHPSQAHALIWSRLIITTILSHYFPDEFEKAVIEDEFEDSVSCKGLPFKYAKIGATKGRVAIAMSTLPVFLSFKTYDTTNSMKELVRMRFSVIFNDWIDRQENPELAFYHLWALTDCLSQRGNPTVRAVIGDDDQLSVRGSSVMLRETFKFWSSSEWICAVQGPALTTLLTAFRTPEDTIRLLRDIQSEKAGK